jgi:hypothetical protein
MNVFHFFFVVAVLRQMEPRAEHSSGRFKQRAVIEFLTAEAVVPIEIHLCMQFVYGDDCADSSTVLRRLDQKM